MAAHDGWHVNSRGETVRDSLWDGLVDAEVFERGRPASEKFPSDRPLRIYLAGAIEKNCWRHRIVPGLRAALSYLDSRLDRKTLPIGRHTYVGPFFVRCDHGCAHGPTLHGAAAGDEHSGCVQGCDRDQVRRFCREQIDSADLVFAWIDRLHAYGTIWELGYAAAKKKDIVVRWPMSFDISEMWLCLPEDARPAEDVVAAFQESVAPQAPLALPVDSPIEAMLRDALLPLIRDRFVLKTRHETGRYKLDFALWSEKSWRVAVECDGHEFHEKTKEQAARDRTRERDLVFEGWTVLRFTGSEIYRDAQRCAQDVLKHCLKLDEQ